MRRESTYEMTVSEVGVATRMAGSVTDGETAFWSAARTTLFKPSMMSDAEPWAERVRFVASVVCTTLM